MLAIRVVAVTQASNCLIVDLGGRDDPEDKACLVFEIIGVYEVYGFYGEEGFTAAGRDFEAEAGKGPAEAVAARGIWRLEALDF